MSQKGLRVEFSVPRPHKRQEEAPATPFKDPVPRIARLLALAHKWEDMVRRGEVASYAEMARITEITPARVTQICNLTLLSPEIQDQLLNPERSDRRTPEGHLRTVLRHPVWSRQQAAWVDDRQTGW